MVKEEYKKIIIKIIKSHLPNCTIYLFGSRSRTTHSPGSDIDIAIDATEKIDRHIIYKIKEEIEEKNIPFFVDIVDLQSSDENIKSQITKDGVIWNN
jgi:type I restriction enzyme S subunit